MNAGDGELLRSLIAVNDALCAANRTMGQLLVEVLRNTAGFQLPADELRAAASKLVLLGGDMTTLGVEIGMRGRPGPDS